jgi:hypothetical protein
MMHRRKPRQGMTNIVGNRRAAIVDRDAGKAGAEQDVSARIEIGRLLDGRFQRSRDQTKRLMGIKLRAAMPGFGLSVNVASPGADFREISSRLQMIKVI